MMYRLMSYRTAAAATALTRMGQRMLLQKQNLPVSSTLSSRIQQSQQRRRHSSLVFKNNHYESIQCQYETDPERITRMDFEADEEYITEPEEDDELLESSPLASSYAKPAYFEKSVHSHFPSILEEENEFPKKVFQSVDEDHDGLISFKEFENALDDLHYEEIKTMQKVRTNEDGFVFEAILYLIPFRSLPAMHYTIQSIHSVVEVQSKALEKKMELILNIEDQLLDLASTCEEKEDAYYNNIGMTTANDIDVLFVRSALGRNKIRKSIDELKGLVEEAKVMYSRSWDTDV
jgi:hypothetical protein